MIKFIGYYISLFTVFLMLLGCQTKGCDMIPDVSVYSALSGATHLAIFSSNGWAYASGGISGLIVHNGSRGMVAYDRCSPINANERNILVVEDGVFVVDELLGAKWLLADGSPVSIAECPLKSYAVAKNGEYYIVKN